MLSRLGGSLWCSACRYFNTLQKKPLQMLFFVLFAFSRKLLTIWLNGDSSDVESSEVVQTLSKNMHIFCFCFKQKSQNKGANEHDEKVCRQHLLPLVCKCKIQVWGFLCVCDIVPAHHLQVIEGLSSFSLADDFLRHNNSYPKRSV